MIMGGRMSQNGRAEGFDEWNVVEDDGVLDTSDTLDDDRVADPLDTGVAPADRWSGANRFGTTPAEARAGESLEQLLAEEEPDVDPYAEDGADDEDELSRRGYERDVRAGRLVADDQGFGEDAEAESVAWDVGIDAGGASAEEAAVHVVDDPFGPGEGPLR
ncbi:DUF5709 domain-containing protein [Micromonospora sp. CPCC 206061]|uniref:DUF5709 domain-containing protein n=1 Tax=Micromonospora sp. CPCC 206061 TaxID=3122410 RepID=UPI002FF3E781